MEKISTRKIKSKTPLKSRREPGQKSKVIVSGQDFSDVEDSKNFIKILTALVGEAGRDASREAEAAGLPRIFVRENKLISVKAGEREVVLRVSPSSEGPYFTKFRKGSVFHAAKK